MNTDKKILRIAFDTLGCKLNQAETEALIEKFIQAGYRITGSDNEFDIYVLNTCTVTHIADRKARHLLRMAHRRNPEAVLVAIGCYAEHASKELSEIDGVKLIFGNDEKMALPDILSESGLVSVQKGVQQNDNQSGNFRTRSFISIQEGCNKFCSYCIVPYVRGREKSVQPEQVVKAINDKVLNGYKEVVLTGTEIGSYNYDGMDLRGLIGIILSNTGIQRLRLSSLQPQEVTPELMALWKNERLCPHFHLSLQSGSDAVLKRMRRVYTTDDYAKAVSLIRSAVGDVAVTTDVIVGFPGETDEEFEESYNFCREIGFSRIHVFSYSKRRGTVANIMPNQIVPMVKKQRSDKMLALAKGSELNFRRSFIGRNLSVLWEQADSGIWNGLTGNYIKVYAKKDEDLTNQITEVHLECIYEDGVWGEIMK